jgi:hypothetical protein
MHLHGEGVKKNIAIGEKMLYNLVKYANDSNLSHIYKFESQFAAYSLIYLSKFERTYEEVKNYVNPAHLFVMF